MATYKKSGTGDDSLVRAPSGYSPDPVKKILKKIQTRGKKFKVGEFEVVGVTDVVVSVYITQPDLQISEFDSTTPVEDLTIDPFILAGIDVFDSTTPTEYRETAQGSFVDVFDSPGVTDVVVDLIVTEDYDINVYDQAGVTENLETAQESFIDVYDQPGVTDVVDGILRVYTIDEFDSTGVTESIETAQESFIDVYDQPTVTDVVTDVDVITPVADLTIDVFDTAGVTDVVTGIDTVWVFAFVGSGAPDSQYGFGRNARADLDAIYTLTGDWEEVRVIIEAHSTQDTPVRGMAIGRKGTSDPDYFPNEWIRFLFGAAETTTVPAGTEIASDWMLFPIRGARDYWLHVKWLATDYAKAGAFFNCYRKITDTDETEIEDVSGYSFSGFGSNVVKYLEVRRRTHIVDEWETVAVTDVVVDVQLSVADLFVNIQEPVITLVEDVTVDPLIIPGIDVYDEPGVTDFVEMAQESFIDVWDQPTVTDVVAGILRVYTVDEFDTTGVTDVVEMGQGSFIDVYDAATPVENVDIDPLILAGIDVFDTTGVTDEETVAVPAAPYPEINVFDATTPVEDVTVDPLILAGIDVFDEAAVTEQVETAQVSFIDVWDATTPTDVVDDLVVSEDYDISVYDETGVTESVETAQESFIDVWDQPSVTDVVVGILKVFTISEFDTTAVQESVVTAQESFIDVWDTAGVTDVVDEVNVFYDPYEIDVWDATTPSDVLVGVTIPDADLFVSEFDQAGVTESVSTAQESFIDAWDGVTATDIVDDVDISAAIHEIDVFDQAGVTEDVVIDPLVIPGIDVFDSVAVTEFQETSLSSPGLSVFDSVAVTEDITTRVHLPVSVIDTTAVTESVAAKASDLAVDLSDSVAVTDVVQALIPVDLDISVFDAAAVTDVVVGLSIVFAADVSALGPWFKGRTTSVTFKSRECDITFSTVKKAA